MGAYFTISSIVYISILLFYFFSKGSIHNIETRIYKFLISTTLIGLTLDATGYFLFVMGIDTNTLLYQLIAKTMLLYFLAWVFGFTLYIYAISKDQTNYDNYILEVKKAYHRLLITYIVLIPTILILPITFDIRNNIVFPNGIGVNATYIIIAFCLVACLYNAFKNLKNLVSKKYTPLFALIVLIIAAAIVQNKFPDLFLVDFALSILVVILYFSIENPDIRMLEQIKKAKDRSDKSNEAKENFLFNVTGEINEQINNINNSYDELLNSNDITYIKDKIRESKLYVNRAKKKLNESLDISEEDVKNIKLTSNKYNFNILIQEINSLAKNKINLLDIEYRTNISSDIPSYLYGDSIKIKQIILSLIDNSIKNTTKGFIELRTNCIIKNDICRLIFIVEDSGNGMEVEKINKIFDKDDYFDYRASTLSLSNIKKIANLIGGTLNIDSTINKGTSVTVTINQKISKDNSLDKYEEYINKIETSKILLVNDDEKKTEIIKRIFEKFSLDIKISNMGEDCLNRIRNNEYYDLIILNDDMTKLTGIQVFNKLKKIDNFNIPVVLVTKEENKNKLEETDFFDVISNPLTKDKISELINKLNESKKDKK